MRLILFSIPFLIFSFIGCGGDNHGYVDQSLKYETNKIAIKSPAEIENDLKDLTLDAMIGEQGYLEKMALEYEEYFGQPIGKFAGINILINRDLIVLLNCKLNMLKRKCLANRIFSGLEKLKLEINRAIRETPKNDVDKLKKLHILLEVNEKLRDDAEFINQNIYKIDPFQNQEEIIRKNANIAQINAEVDQRNQKLREENEALKLRINTLTIRILGHEFAKSIVLPGALRN